MRHTLQRQAAALPGTAVCYVPVASSLRSALALRPGAGQRPLLLVLSRDALQLEGVAPEDAADAAEGAAATADAHLRVHKQQLGTLLSGLAVRASARGELGSER